MATAPRIAEIAERKLKKNAYHNETVGGRGRHHMKMYQALDLDQI